MKQLPKTLSATIRLALKDLTAVEKSSKYVVDMGMWHGPVFKLKEEHDKCSVCFAGSVMAKELHAEVGRQYDPEDFGFPNARKLRALDEVRIGAVRAAVERFYNIDLSNLGDFPVPKIKDRRFVEYTERNRDKFHAQMAEIADDLESKGL